MSDERRDRVYREIEQELGFGIVPNVFKAMATHPGLLESNWNLFRAVVLTGRLPRILKEMVGVVVSAVHGSEYARRVHLHSLGMQGVNQDVLRGLVDGDVDMPGLPHTSLAVLRFARTSAERPGSADRSRLEAAGLSTEEVLEVIGAIQVFTAINVFTDAMHVPIDEV